jgi:hypothetical protein
MIFAVRNYALFIADVATVCRRLDIVTPDPWNIKSRNGKYIILVTTEMVEGISKVDASALERFREY